MQNGIKMMIEEKYRPFESKQFKKGCKLAKKQGLDMSLLRWGIEQLAQDILLPATWKDHQLKDSKS